MVVGRGCGRGCVHGCGGMWGDVGEFVECEGMCTTSQTTEVHLSIAVFRSSV